MILSTVQIQDWGRFISSLLQGAKAGHVIERSNQIQANCFLAICGPSGAVEGGRWVEAFSWAELKCTEIYHVYPVLEKFYASE